MYESLGRRPGGPTALRALAGGFAAALLMQGCGAQSESPAATPPPALAGSSAPDGGSGGVSANEPDVPTSTKDASRLLNQASFGPSADSLALVRQMGPRKYVLTQMDAPVSQYTYATTQSTLRARVHTSGSTAFCETLPEGDRDGCWRDWFAPIPVQYEFFRHAVANPDQLRQRMAFALSQIFVTSGRELDASYGFAHYHQMLRENAFGNYGTLLAKVSKSPFMGAYLNMVDNDPDAPNENYARELLQLFSIGPCELEQDGSLKTGSCVQTYSNEVVRNYAFALTGWTFPAGGVDPWCNAACQKQRWTRPRYYKGDMVPVQQAHDAHPRALLSGVTLPASRTPQQALDAVVASLVAHPNAAPFVARQLIQFFVTSNPSPAYVSRVATAFADGSYAQGGAAIGTGQRGDLRATIAAVLLDDEARGDAFARDARFGKLREPVQYLAGAIRAIDGQTDGESIGSEWSWSGQLGQAPFLAPSVFNFYPPDFPLAGTTMVAPQMGAESVNTALVRINFANALIFWWGERGQAASGNVADAIGTRVRFARWESLLQAPEDSPRVVDAVDELLLGGRLNATEKGAIVAAMDQYKPSMTWLANQDPPSNWKRERVKTAFYLMLASPQYQVQR